MAGQTDGWMNGWRDGWPDRRTRPSCTYAITDLKLNHETDRVINIQRDGCTDRRTERRTGGRKDGRTDGRTEID